MIGAVVVAAGFDAVLADGLIGQVLVPAVVAPLLALSVAATVTRPGGQPATARSVPRQRSHGGSQFTTR